MQVSPVISAYVEKNAAVLEKYSSKLAAMYRKCFVHTFDTISDDLPTAEGRFLHSGDIPGMWLRDSSTQMWPYVRFCDDAAMRDLVRSVLLRQFFYIGIDPYANGFNETDNDRGHVDDLPRKSPWVWERKYEVDSLAYPIRLLYAYWQKTGDEEMAKERFLPVMRVIYTVWKTEQHHFEQSPYRFFRKTDRYNDTIHNNGMGEPVGYTGMTWQGFRPSDDAGTYGYSIPSNLFAWLELGHACEMLADVDAALVADMQKLRDEIYDGVCKFGIVRHETYGNIFAYETDGLGHYELMDDANIPSLISLPYLGFDLPELQEVYQNTRRFILSHDNPYYYEGKYAKGIGSPHEYSGYIWHIGLSIQGLTAKSHEEMREVLQMLITTDADTGYMHECFDADDPFSFRRPFFTWSDSMFCEFVEKCIREHLFD